MTRDANKRCKVIGWWLVVLSVALVPLVAGSAQSQPAADDQYRDNRHEGRTGVGYDAADDALTASEAFDNPEASGSEQSAPSAAESPPAPDEPGTAAAGEIVDAATSGPGESVALDALPETGGSSPLLLGVLLVAGGMLACYIARSALGP
jgi:hypothetical protein